MTHDRNPGTKLIIAGLVAAVLAVPLFMVFLLVYDRENQSQTARASIAEGWGGPQQLAGPLLALPYEQQVSETVRENNRDVTRTRTVSGTLYLAPETLALDTRLTPQLRRRSIYEAVLYDGEAQGRAVYRLPADLDRLGVKPEQIAFARAELRFGISDPRGLKPDSRVTVGGQTIAPQPGNGLAATRGAGFFAPVDATAITAAPLAAGFRFGFRGHSQLTLAPRAGHTEWKVASSWRHPSFTGGFLPDSPGLSNSGFSATYRISNLALGATLASLEDKPAGDPAAVVRTGTEVNVALIEPVDLYSQVNRAVKYGFLFIGFTFMAFLLFDLVGGARVSAVEYLLVGAGLVLFFVMLLAFAEVTGFAIAYAVAAAAVDALLTAYSAAVLGSWKRGGFVAALLAALYGVLYVLLSLEDYSLLIGSVLLFAALASVMYLTRNLEWSSREAEAPAT